jgi:hypothetical protein
MFSVQVFIFMGIAIENLHCHQSLPSRTIVCIEELLSLETVEFVVAASIHQFAYHDNKSKSKAKKHLID